MFALAFFGGVGLLGASLSFVAIGLYRMAVSPILERRRYRGEVAQLWDRR
jgi:uncharacterized membrane protein YeiB